jgi:hypothetical protein
MASRKNSSSVKMSDRARQPKPTTGALMTCSILQIQNRTLYPCRVVLAPFISSHSCTLQEQRIKFRPNIQQTISNHQRNRRYQYDLPNMVQRLASVPHAGHFVWPGTIGSQRAWSNGIARDLAPAEGALSSVCSVLHKDRVSKSPTN